MTLNYRNHSILFLTAKQATERAVYMHLLQSNTLNLDRHTLRQLSDGDAAAGRLVSEELLVGAVHLGEVDHVREEDLSVGS